LRFFFYGTLIDPEMLGAVLRRPVHPARRRNAVLRGYRRVYREGVSYLILVADTASDVEGVVVSALTAPFWPKFFCRALHEASRVPWALEEWLRRYGRTFVRCLRRRRTTQAD
jgi:hypothetical protein